jgi:hypothetical protein
VSWIAKARATSPEYREVMSSEGTKRSEGRVGKLTLEIFELNRFSSLSS